MKSLLVIVLIGIYSLSIIAQEQSKVENTEYQKLYKHSLGIGAGFTTGLGVSYRYFPKKIGFQINLAPYYENYGKEAFISAGMTFLYNINESKYTAFYAYFGNHILHTSFQKQRGDYEYNPLTSQYQYNAENYTKVRDIINSGIGVGFEFSTTKKVTLNIMGGYAQYNTFERLFFTGELALYYRFN
ncbi:MAG: hypothetical protein A2033_13450 [Bacteroidetes bacterium GWA2_31_9]|nr:MAG: hypothetical protein A2033_13450 [Bacteroidetes bacterium GWA2_31_9]